MEKERVDDLIDTIEEHIEDGEVDELKSILYPTAEDPNGVINFLVQVCKKHL